MGVRAVKYLLIGQITLWVSLVISAVLLPSIVYNNQGISHFGVHSKTILPYGLGFLVCGYLTSMAAHAITHTDHVTIMLSRALMFLSLLLLAVLLTPFSVNTLLDYSHTVVGGLLFAFELILAAWLVRLLPFWFNEFLFAMQCVGSLLSAFSLLGITGLMFTGQLIAEIAFGILLVRAVSQVLHMPPHEVGHSTLYGGHKSYKVSS